MFRRFGSGGTSGGSGAPRVGGGKMFPAGGGGGGGGSSTPPSATANLQQLLQTNNTRIRAIHKTMVDSLQEIEQKIQQQQSSTTNNNNIGNNNNSWRSRVEALLKEQGDHLQDTARLQNTLMRMCQIGQPQSLMSLQFQQPQQCPMLDGGADDAGGAESASNINNINKQLFIGGLGQIQEDTLRQYYSQWGQVVDCRVIRDPATRSSRGFGFVTFATAQMANVAMSHRPHIINGKAVNAVWAVPWANQPVAGGGGGGQSTAGGVIRPWGVPAGVDLTVAATRSRTYVPARLDHSLNNWCYACGDKKHKSWDCKKVTKCFRCSEPGHISRRCPRRRETCQACGGLGHVLGECRASRMRPNKE